MKRIFYALTITTAFILLASANIQAQNPQNPSLQIITPSENQTIYGNKIPVLFSVENFELANYQTNKTPVPGQGHILLWLDDQNPTVESATKVTADNFTYSDVNFGQHTLRAELVGNDSKSLNPPKTVTVTFKNESVASPTPVATSGFDKNTALVILIVVALVIIAAWWYTKEEDKKEAEKAIKKPTAKKSSTEKRRKVNKS